MSTPRVALLGLGIMGTGMANRLLGAGFPLAVYNRNPERVAPLVSAGARAGTSPRDAATGADIVIAIVADDNASRAVWLGDEGALAGVSPGALLIDSSTLSPTWIRELAEAARGRCCELLDAPVTGSRPQAAAGELLFLVGGSEAALERARPALAVMSRAIVHVGPTGSGALMKLVNNFVCGVQAAALAEGIAVIERSGLNASTALEVLLTGAPGSPLVKTLTARMTERAYTPPNFSLRLMRKDLTYAREEAARHGVTLETLNGVFPMIDRAIEDGRSEQDFSSIVEPLRRS
jgi:3-hydroxyisobutyrate dehydrogenase